MPERLSRQEGTTLCQRHWGTRRERAPLLAVEPLRAFLIWRNLLDVMISSYHHDINKFGRQYADFADFWRRGERALYASHHLNRYVWEQAAPGGRGFRVFFEELRQDFAAAAAPMLAFAGIEDVDLARLEDALSIERMRETRNVPEGRFFRKGVSGEHRSFDFTPAAERGTQRIDRMSPLALRALVTRERLRSGRVAAAVRRRLAAR